MRQLVVVLALACSAVPGMAFADSGLRLSNTFGLDAGGGAWRGTSHTTLDLRYGFDIIPDIQMGLVVGANVLDDAGPRAAMFVRGRFLRGGDERAFYGHALTVALGMGALFDQEMPFIEPAIGWEYRHHEGFGVGIDSGVVQSMKDTTGWPFARFRVSWSV